MTDMRGNGATASVTCKCCGHTRDVVIRYCEQCGTRMEMTPGQRKSRMYCSNACKVRAYRERKTEVAHA